MILTQIRRGRSREGVTLLFGGWGAEPALFSSQMPARFDAYLLSNFTSDEPATLDALLSERAGEPLFVIGWSFGVRRAAEWLAASRRVPARFAAVAGTFTPIDRRTGIAPVVAKATLDAFDDEKRRLFWQNAAEAEPPAFSRSSADWARELAQALSDFERPLAALPEGIATEAVIPVRDRIIPVVAQRRFWTERCVRIFETNAPHAAFDLIEGLVADPLADLAALSREAS